MICILGNVIWDYYWPYVLPPYRFGILFGLLVEITIVYEYTSSSSTFFHRTVIANVASWLLGGFTVSLLPLPRRNFLGEYHGNDMIAAYAIAIILSIVFEAVVYWKAFSIKRPWTVSTIANLASYLVIILIERPFSNYGEDC